MMNGFVRLSAVLIGVYIVAAHASDFGKLVTSAGTAGQGFAKTLQGRG
jgi:hypothetical protein